MNNLHNFKLQFENVQFNRKKAEQRLYKAWLKETNRQAAKDLLKWVRSLSGDALSKLRHKFSASTTIGALKRRSFHIRWEHLVIAFLLGLLWARPAGASIPETVSPQTAHKPIAKLHVKRHKKAKEVYVAPKPQTAVRVAPRAPQTPRIVKGDNFYMQYIIDHESGGNPYAVNASSGACGLFQELPCGKSGCARSDVACQKRWGTQYAISRYGSWEGAYNFWVSNHWW